MLARNKYETRAVLTSVNRYLSSGSTVWLSEGMQRLPWRRQKCIDISGEYFEKEWKDSFFFFEKKKKKRFLR